MKGTGIKMNWLLIVVLAIIVVNALIGMKAGFIKTAFSLCSMIIALVLSIWISPYVNDFMRGNDKIYDTITTKVEKILPVIEEKADQNDQVSIIEGLKLPQSLKDSLIKNNNKEVYKELSADNFKEYISSYLTGIIINAMAYFVTFAIILIALWVISFALNIISKLPLINQINKLAGLMAGLLHGLIVVWLFFILLTVFGSSEWGHKALEMIGDDQILSLIYNNNILIDFITSATKMLK